MITPKAGVIMSVQLDGHTADMAELGAIATQHGLCIVEDSCPAFGWNFRGKCAGRSEESGPSNVPAPAPCGPSRSRGGS